MPVNLSAAQDVPSFEGDIGAFEGAPERTVNDAFNDFMMDHYGDAVFLSVFLDAEQREEFEQTYEMPDGLDAFVFTVRNDDSDAYLEGNEYLIHPAAETTEQRHEYDPGTGRLSGYFEVWDINGPRQGWMSVNLRPIDP